MIVAQFLLTAGTVSVISMCIFLYVKQSARRKTQRYTAWLGPCVLLLLLAGCGGTSQPTSTTQVTPKTHVNPKSSHTPTRITSTASTMVASDWPTYHNDVVHSGYIANAQDPQQLTAGWKAQLDGAVYAEPLVVNGTVIVATEGDSIYALDENSGQVKWRAQLGAPQPQGELPCGDIDPLGITGTPVYDPATGLIFAIAEIHGPQHILFGVDANTGQVKLNRNVDPGGVNPKPYQQRSALTVSQGKVYWAYGGLAGDCGQYVGTVMAVATNGQGPILSYQVPTPREGGIWTPSGLTLDAAGNLYAAVGNGEETQGNWDHSDSVLRLSPTLQLEDAFAPQQWQQDNANDADLGSMAPTLLPNKIIFIAGKSSLGYTLHADALGGVGGQIQAAQVCNGGQAFGGTANVGMTVIVPCTNGLLQLQISTDGHMSPGWQAPRAMHFPPIIGGHTVYDMQSDGTLNALNLDTGALRASVNIGGTPLPHFDTPTLADGKIFVGTNTGVAEVNIA